MFHSPRSHVFIPEPAFCCLMPPSWFVNLWFQSSVPLSISWFPKRCLLCVLGELASLTHGFYLHVRASISLWSIKTWEGPSSVPLILEPITPDHSDVCAHLLGLPIVPHPQELESRDNFSGSLSPRKPQCFPAILVSVHLAPRLYYTWPCGP